MVFLASNPQHRNSQLLPNKQPQPKVAVLALQCSSKLLPTQVQIPQT
jgi:hypothetical protein